MIASGSGDNGTNSPLQFGKSADLAGRLSRSATIALVISPLGFILISTVRLLIISNYNTLTASAVVASGGYVDTLLGTIIPLVPIFISYIALLLLFFNRVVLGWLALLLTAFISPAKVSPEVLHQFEERVQKSILHTHSVILVIFLILGILAVVFLLIQLASLHGFSGLIAATICILLVPIFLYMYPFPINRAFYTQVIRQPWLPAQVITLDSGKRMIGYVLSNNESWLVVLNYTNRTIRYIPQHDVSALRICDVGQVPTTRPLVALTPTTLSAQSHIQPCYTRSDSRSLTGASPSGSAGQR